MNKLRFQFRHLLHFNLSPSWHLSTSWLLSISYHEYVSIYYQEVDINKLRFSKCMFCNLRISTVKINTLNSNADTATSFRNQYEQIKKLQQMNKKSHTYNRWKKTPTAITNEQKVTTMVRRLDISFSLAFFRSTRFRLNPEMSSNSKLKSRFSSGTSSFQ